MKKIDQIIQKYRNQQNLSQQELADALTEALPGVSLTRQAVHNWESGRQAPGYLFLVSVFMAYGDWRCDFARECLAVLKPELWAEEPCP